MPLQVMLRPGSCEKILTCRLETQGRLAKGPQTGINDLAVGDGEAGGPEEDQLQGQVPHVGMESCHKIWLLETEFTKM